MTQKRPFADIRMPSRWEEHKFLVLVALTILTSLFLVMVALRLYASSGAAQLDLSRREYSSVREQATKTSSFTAFPANGSLDEESINTFRSLYEQKYKEATALDSFGGDVMSDASLNLEVPPAEP